MGSTPLRSFHVPKLPKRHHTASVTHPLLRLGPPGLTSRFLTQREGEDRKRIFDGPPLPWRESLEATGVKTPDNQSGILKSLRFPTPKHDSPVRRERPLTGCRRTAQHTGGCRGGGSMRSDQALGVCGDRGAAGEGEGGGAVGG